jgi:hypothetical protein
MKVFSSLARTAALMVVVALVSCLSASAQDRALPIRQPLQCGASLYPYYNVSDRLWYCSTMPSSAVDSTSTTSGTVQSTEYTLNSLTLPANSFNANTRGFTASAFGTLAANANAKNIKIYVGSVAVATVTGSTASAKDYAIHLTCVRTGSSAQTCMATIQVDTAVAPTMAVTALTQTDTQDIVIAVKTANTAAAAASGTGKGLLVRYSY